MELTTNQAIWQKFLINFPGIEPPEEVLQLLRDEPVGGVTLFRGLNLVTAAEARELSRVLQQTAYEHGWPPLLIAADQEGGQLMAIGGETTPFPGNMALGAAGSVDLAYRFGYAAGHELRAMGINVNYAPDCDLALNPDNPVVGVRSFGEDPEQASRLSAAVVTGLQEAGVAATAKHFPGHSDVALDSHQGLPVIPHSLDRLRQVELRPFAAAIQSGVHLVMTGHLALTALDSELQLPATLSRAVINDLLRRELGFKGVVITDALDMGSIQQGPGLVIDGLAAILAGVDLLLFHNTPAEMEDIFLALRQAARRGLLPQALLRSSVERILELKTWLAGFEQPSFDVIGCKEHQALALEIASRSVTLVHDHAQRLPLQLQPQDRLAVILPIPQDLTPADTSSYVEHTFPQLLRRYHPSVEERLVPINPEGNETRAALEWARDYDQVIIGTINAKQHPSQAILVNALLEARVPTIAVALRMPGDLQTYPSVPTYLCTYSLLPPSMEALAMGLFGKIPFQGKLPVRIPGS